MSEFQDRIRKSPKFDVRNIGVGGPIYIVQTTLLPNDNFRKGYDNIQWEKEDNDAGRNNDSPNLP